VPACSQRSRRAGAGGGAGGGRGPYRAPDWTADWIHREVLGWLDQQAQREYGKNYAELSPRDQATLNYDAQQAFRKNTYDPATDKVTLSADRVRSIEAVAAYYDKLFGADPEMHKLREAYAMKEDTLPSAEKRAKGPAKKPARKTTTRKKTTTAAKKTTARKKTTPKA